MWKWMNEWMEPNRINLQQNQKGGLDIYRATSFEMIVPLPLPVCLCLSLYLYKSLCVCVCVSMWHVSLSIVFLTTIVDFSCSHSLFLPICFFFFFIFSLFGECNSDARKHNVTTMCERCHFNYGSDCHCSNRLRANRIKDKIDDTHTHTHINWEKDRRMLSSWLKNLITWKMTLIYFCSF